MEQFYNTIQNTILRAFRLQRLEKEVSDRNPLFVFDDKKANRTFMKEKRKGNSLIVKNINKNKVHHICVDGVLIAPNSAYPDGVKDRLRNDCMLLTSNQLTMIELKLDLSSTKKDTIKDDLEKALHQIDTFYQYLNDTFDGSLMQNFTNKKGIALVAIPNQRQASYRSLIESIKTIIKNKNRNIFNRYEVNFCFEEYEVR